ncbi:FAD binding domain-containing protein [Sporomusa sp.]|uniref:FAD binding domain-containing protein n=1 Tax=Sporomusa sp. TaxID=2078658 RepID=UPI002C21AD1F|nr:FAD binding domain-containing protein [Sporomusa sp.]HWR45943.1 FAD binding domain-containing protein [Sporomusa sp.]
MIGYEITGFSRLDDVLRKLMHTSAKTVFISGGTDFINKGVGKDAELVIDLSQVADLKYIKDTGSEVRIGGGTTFSAIAASPVIKAKVTALAQAARQVGSVQIRNRATIGGNIASASPAGDSLPVLAAFNASICTAGSKGTRILTLEEALNGLQDKELITEIVITTPVLANSGFVKIGSRSQVTIAKISLAAIVSYDSKKRMIIVGKAALGALGKGPVCPAKVQEFFNQRIVDKCFASDLALLLAETVDEAITGRASHPYKKAAVKGLAYDLTGLLFDACENN